MCPLCLRADFSTRLRLAWTTNGTLLLLAFQTRVRSPAAFQRPPCVLATRLLLCARRLVAWRHTCVQLRSPHNRIRTHCSQAHTYAGTGRDDHRDQARRCQDRACQDLGDHAPPSGTRASGGRQSGGRQSGGRERRATERRATERQATESGRRPSGGRLTAHAGAAHAHATALGSCACIL